MTYRIKTELEQLRMDIEQQSRIYKDPKRFIKNRDLRLYHFNKNPASIVESDLPLEAHLGMIYLIKGANIIECYFYCDYNFSTHYQINNHIPTWLGKIEPINIANGDPEKINYYLSGCQTISSPDVAHYLILQFIQSGFVLYCK